MHAILSYPGNRPTHPPPHTNTQHTATNPQTGPITIHCTANLSAQCKEGNGVGLDIHCEEMTRALPNTFYSGTENTRRERPRIQEYLEKRSGVRNGVSSVYRSRCGCIFCREWYQGILFFRITCIHLSNFLSTYHFRSSGDQQWAASVATAYVFLPGAGRKAT